MGAARLRPGPVIQSQELNKPGFVAEITEARRSEGVLSLKIRLKNTGAKAERIPISEGVCGRRLGRSLRTMLASGGQRSRSGGLARAVARIRHDDLLELHLLGLEALSYGARDQPADGIEVITGNLEGHACVSTTSSETQRVP